MAVSGRTLEAAAAHVEAALGVAMGAGGRHDVFGTYNRLLGLEDGLYLEAIAIDPEAPQPGRARWFDLDRFAGPPRLTNWICRTGDLEGAAASLPGSGTPVALARGDLRWQMAVPQDGCLPFDNLSPALIRWQGELHPAAMLAPSGCRLRRLVIAHPQADDLKARCEAGLRDTRVVFETGAPAMEAEFETPHGRRVLR